MKRFIWIDDESQRKASAINLATRLKVKVEFVDVSNNTKAFDQLLKKTRPALILIDHNLKYLNTEEFKKGSTVAAMIREFWNDCPIVCVTAQDMDIGPQKRLQYDDIFAMNKISRHYETIQAIAKGFEKLKRLKPDSSESILKLLSAPKEDAQRLMAIMPNELKSNFSDSALYFNISHWIRKMLFIRPGFLYDRLWTSTFLGIKEASFKKIEHLFETAKYKGAFSDPSNERWWKSRLQYIVSSKIQVLGLPWEKRKET